MAAPPSKIFGGFQSGRGSGRAHPVLRPGSPAAGIGASGSLGGTSFGNWEPRAREALQKQRSGLAPRRERQSADERPAEPGREFAGRSAQAGNCASRFGARASPAREQRLALPNREALEPRSEFGAANREAFGLHLEFGAASREAQKLRSAFPAREAGGQFSGSSGPCSLRTALGTEAA